MAWGSARDGRAFRRDQHRAGGHGAAVPCLDRSRGFTHAHARMTSLATHAKRFIGPLLANRWTGLVAARVLRDRIPHRGLTIDTSSPVVTPEIKAALRMRVYESSEYRFVRRYVPTDCDVIELGGSLGVISCTIRRRID